jgi:hypothetical protein
MREAAAPTPTGHTNRADFTLIDPLLPLVRTGCPLPDRFTSPRRALSGFVFITGCDQDAVAHNLEYASLLRTPNHIKSDGFMVDLYALDRNAFCMLVVRFGS